MNYFYFIHYKERVGDIGPEDVWNKVVIIEARLKSYRLLDTTRGRVQGEGTYFIPPSWRGADLLQFGEEKLLEGS